MKAELTIEMKNFDNRVENAKLLFLIAILFAIFYAEKFVWINKPRPAEKTSFAQISVTPPVFADFGRTVDGVAKAMRAEGLLKKDSRQWFVAADGKPNGRGTIESPFDLPTALAGADGAIKAGDLVWLRGGKYAGSFTSNVAGEKDKPIYFRAFPGERVILDKARSSRETGTLNVRGANVWFWDFEVANSDDDRRTLDENQKLNPRRGSGINVFAPDTKYINLVVRDNGHGFGLWNEDGGTEIYGCLIFNNGDNKKEHGIYAHNKNGTQTIADNLIFNNAGYGLHIYADSPKSSLKGFFLSGNSIFSNGALTGEDQVADQILVGGVEGAAADRIDLFDNYVYCPPDGATAKNRGVRLGYEDRSNGSVKVWHNLIACRVPLKLLWWKTVEISDNTIITDQLGAEVEGGDLKDFRWENNAYFGKTQAAFEINGKRLNLDEWQSGGFDAGGNHTANGKFSAPQIFLRENRYDPSRMYVTVYNPQKMSAVTINPKDYLRKGEKFEIFDAQNIFGSPIANGIYTGDEINLPLSGKSVTAAVGDPVRQPKHTSADFGVFVVIKMILAIR